MTVANLIGIPAGTWLSDMVSWRVIFPVQRSMGHPHLHPALPSGSANGTSSEHRTERTVPLPEKCGTLAHHGCDHFRKWRYLLLVQPYQPAHEPDCGIRPFRDHHAYGIGRRQHCVETCWVASWPTAIRRANHMGRTGGRDFRTVSLTFFLASYPGIAALMLCVLSACLFGVSAPQKLLLLRFFH